MRNQCLVLYFEGLPKLIHQLSIQSWSKNKNIEFYIITTQKYYKAWKEFCKNWNNIQVKKSKSILNLALDNEIITQENYNILKKLEPKLYICGLKVFIPILYKYIIEKYDIRGWVDHDVIINLNLNLEKYINSDYIYFALRDRIGQLCFWSSNYDLSQIFKSVNEYVKINDSLYFFDEYYFQSHIENKTLLYKYETGIYSNSNINFDYNVERLLVEGVEKDFISFKCHDDMYIKKLIEENKIYDIQYHECNFEKIKPIEKSTIDKILNNNEELRKMVTIEEDEILIVGGGASTLKELPKCKVFGINEHIVITADRYDHLDFHGIFSCIKELDITRKLIRKEKLCYKFTPREIEHIRLLSEYGWLFLSDKVINSIPCITQINQFLYNIHIHGPSSGFRILSTFILLSDVKRIYVEGFDGWRGEGWHSNISHQTKPTDHAFLYEWEWIERLIEVSDKEIIIGKEYDESRLYKPNVREIIVDEFGDEMYNHKDVYDEMRTKLLEIGIDFEDVDIENTKNTITYKYNNKIVGMSNYKKRKGWKSFVIDPNKVVFSNNINI